jgi:aryl-alcohol dehydrogenase-like predicted oxidoreductase
VPCGLGGDDPERCRCTRAWAGLSTLGFTELAEVAERPNLTRSDLRRSVHDLLDRLGYVDDIVQAHEAGEEWFEELDISDPVVAVDRIVDDHVAQVEQICSHFPVGTVLSRLGDLVAETVASRAA